MPRSLWIWDLHASLGYWLFKDNLYIKPPGFNLLKNLIYPKIDIESLNTKNRLG